MVSFQIFETNKAHFHPSAYSLKEKKMNFFLCRHIDDHSTHTGSPFSCFGTLSDKKGLSQLEKRFAISLSGMALEGFNCPWRLWDYNDLDVEIALEEGKSQEQG